MSKILKYCGVGLQLDALLEDGLSITVVPSFRTVPTPAQRAGIKTGEVITGIDADGTHYDKPGFNEFFSLLGAPFSHMQLTIRDSDGIERKVPIVRDFVIDDRTVKEPIEPINNDKLEYIPMRNPEKCDAPLSQDGGHGLPVFAEFQSKKLSRG